MAALEATAEGDGFDAYNLGTGHGHSVREVIAAVEAATGRTVPFTIAPRREGDPPALVSDARRAAAELGWRPRLSDLDSIVRTAAAWMAKDGG